jgi:5,10-methylenetetrahydromethanopterin reductase
MAIARELGKAGTGLFARFSVMHGQVSGPTDAVQDAVFRTIHTTYDMTRHAQAGGQQTLALTDEFMDGFAIIGSADHCVRRLAALEALGLDKFLVTGPNFMAREPEAQVAAAKFTGEVLPRLRQARP